MVKCVLTNFKCPNELSTFCGYEMKLSSLDLVLQRLQGVQDVNRLLLRLVKSPFTFRHGKDPLHSSQVCVTRAHIRSSLASCNNQYTGSDHLQAGGK